MRLRFLLIGIIMSLQQTLTYIIQAEKYFNWRFCPENYTIRSEGCTSLLNAVCITYCHIFTKAILYDLTYGLTGAI